MNRLSPLIIVTGPTAVGKSALAVSLAKEINGEIISADSMQVYRHMDIGSAKIKPDQMQGIKHHLIDILEPAEEFNVTIFQKLARQSMEDIENRGKVPIIAGGTGFYIQSVLYDIDFSPEEENQQLRKDLEKMAGQYGETYLHEELKKVDPESAAAIHKNNIKRVIRALEFYHLTGSKISEHNSRERAKDTAFNCCYFVLNDDREILYESINKRVDLMLDQGLVEEVEHLKKIGCTKDMVSMQGLGYKEILLYLEGEITLEQAVEIIKRDTRHFAKRQLTWFRRERDVVWIEKKQFDYEESAILDYMKEQIRARTKKHGNPPFDGTCAGAHGWELI